MKDYLVRGMSMDGFVKAVAIRSTELVRRGAQIQKTTPNATAAFGRCLTAAPMMGGSSCPPTEAVASTAPANSLE